MVPWKKRQQTSCQCDLYFRLTGGLLALLFAMSVCNAVSAQQSTTVALSRSQLALSEINPYGEILLISPDHPTEYTVRFVAESQAGVSQHVRFSPKRVFVPAGDSEPLRVLYRPPQGYSLPARAAIKLAVEARRADFPCYQSDCSDTEATSFQSSSLDAAQGNVQITPTFIVRLFVN